MTDPTPNLVNQGEAEILREALRLFMGAAYPVCTSIDPRGYRWSEAYLDQARENMLALTAQGGEG